LPSRRRMVAIWAAIAALSIAAALLIGVLIAVAVH
jgi:hypothetical protein